MKARSLTAASVAMLFLLACPARRNEDASRAAPSKSSTAAANTQAVPESSTAMNPVAPPQKAGDRLPGVALPAFTVQLSEYEIRIPDVLPARDCTATIVNAGKENHSFEIIGNGVHISLREPLSRGDQTTLDLHLQPGTYTVDCPVDGHRSKGMSRTVVVK